MKPTVRKYLSEIGRRGGEKSRRSITDAQQEKMQQGKRDRRARMVGPEAIRRAMKRKTKNNGGRYGNERM